MRLKYLAKHFFDAVIVIFCIITINFLLIRFMPGDPVIHILGEEEYFRISSSRPEVIEEVRKEYGLDQSFLVQYKNYLTKTIHLDFGKSYRTKTPVLKTVLFRMKWTLILAVPAIIISSILGGVLGLKAGWHKGGVFDTIVSPVMMFLSSIPANCLAIIFLLIFSFKLGKFPVSGITSGSVEGFKKILDIIWHLTLPLAVLVILRVASYFMLMKSTVQSIKDQEYIQSAVAKGFGDFDVLNRHVLKNALSPYITAVCLQFGHVLAGSMLVEVVFSWKGMGTLIYDSVNAKDFPVLQTSFLFIGICVVFFNFIADIINVAIDPRVKEHKYEG